MDRSVHAGADRAIETGTDMGKEQYRNIDININLNLDADID